MECPHCRLSFATALGHRTLGPVCPICMRPLAFRQLVSVYDRLAWGVPRRRPIGRAKRRRIYTRDLWQCQLCGGHVDPKATGEERASLDHIIPLSEGGSNAEENLRLAHQRCNGARHGQRVR